MPARQKLTKYRLVSNKILTLQTYKRWSPTKASQIMLLENSPHFAIEVRFWVIMLILQLHLDVPLELVKFGE
jgi:hypothetical protein